MSKLKTLEETDLALVEHDELSKKFLAALCNKLYDEREALKKALLWVVHEQCEYNGKVYARLLIHGVEAFKALGLEDECDLEEIEKELFKEG
jgi:hypothetical protein